MKKATFVNGDITLEVRHHDNGHEDFWIQAGQAGIMLNKWSQLTDMYELVRRLIEHENMEGIETLFNGVDDES